jgi:cysteine desulfurase
MELERYFDHAAATPLRREALERQAATDFANPSASHAAGTRARQALDEARRTILRLAGAAGADLVAVSGATEGNNLVLRSAMESRPDGRLLLAADVHASAWFAKERWGRRVDVFDPGRFDPSRITKKHVLVSVLLGNNETGELAAIRPCGVPLHVDVVQALGRVPLDLAALGPAYAVFSAHKFGGPRGVGGVIVLGAPPLAPQIEGGGQERGVRSGTENVAGLAGAAAALEAACHDREAEGRRLRGLAIALTEDLRARIPGMLVNSDAERGLPGFVSVSFPGLTGETLAAEMSVRGFAVSAGSACGSGRLEPSRVILARGRSRSEALGTLRISMGRGNTAESVRELAAVLANVVAKQRALG